MASLKVSYSIIDEAITQLNSIYSNPKDTYIAIGRLKEQFSISTSACANELIVALDKYKEIYEIIRDLCKNSADMLQVAKYMYSDMDDTMSNEVNE